MQIYINSFIPFVNSLVTAVTLIHGSSYVSVVWRLSPGFMVEKNGRMSCFLSTQSHRLVRW